MHLLQVFRLDLPNLVDIERQPFDPNTFQGEYAQPTSTAQTKRTVPLDSVIRWRFVSTPDGG